MCCYLFLRFRTCRKTRPPIMTAHKQTKIMAFGSIDKFSPDYLHRLLRYFLIMSIVTMHPVDKVVKPKGTAADE